MLLSIISLSTGDANTMLGYAGTLISDLSPVWITIVGVGLGLLVVVAVIHAIRGN